MKSYYGRELELESCLPFSGTPPASYLIVRLLHPLCYIGNLQRESKGQDRAHHQRELGLQVRVLRMLANSYK